MDNYHVLIAGCGDVGCELARQLQSQGNRFQAWGLRRNTSKLPAGMGSIPGNLSDRKTLGNWPRKIDYLVYAAAPGGRTEESYRITYTQGLHNVLNRLQEEDYHPARIFFTSSTSVYHQSSGEWVDETSDTCPQGFPGQVMLEAESLLYKSPFPSTAVRFGGIYGPGRNRLLNRVKAGEGCQAGPVVYSNRIHRDDCAGLLAHLINRDIEGKPVDNLYLGVDSCPAPMHEVLNWLASKLNIGLNEHYPAPARGNKRCSNAKLNEHGYLLKYPDFKAGYSAALANLDH